jgi:hypothetical protein
VSDEATTSKEEEYLGRVNVRDLGHRRWPIISALASRFVDRMELQRYQRRLLGSGKWKIVRAVPRRDESGVLSSHVFDVYAVPATNPSAPGPVDVEQPR